MLQYWVHRFNAHGPACLKDSHRHWSPRQVSAAQQAELSQLVETDRDRMADRMADGVVRWRCVDGQRVIEERFGVACHERTIGN
jgi:transposase